MTPWANNVSLAVPLNSLLESRRICPFVYYALSIPWHPLVPSLQCLQVPSATTWSPPQCECNGLFWNAWQWLLPGLFSTHIWELSKQMHTHLHFLGRRAENLRILVGNLCCSENLTHHAHNIKEHLFKTRPFTSFSLCCLASPVFDAFY